MVRHGQTGRRNSTAANSATCRCSVSAYLFRTKTPRPRRARRPVRKWRRGQPLTLRGQPFARAACVRGCTGPKRRCCSELLGLVVRRPKLVISFCSPAANPCEQVMHERFRCRALEQRLRDAEENAALQSRRSAAAGPHAEPRLRTDGGRSFLRWSWGLGCGSCGGENT
jgi:hypothetical protein